MTKSLIFSALDKSDTQLLSSTILAGEVGLKQEDFIAKHISQMSRKGMQGFILFNAIILLWLMCRMLYITLVGQVSFDIIMLGTRYHGYIIAAMLMVFIIFMIFPQLSFCCRKNSIYMEKKFQRIFIFYTYFISMLWFVVFSYYQKQVFYDTAIIRSIQPALVVLIPISYIGAMLVLPCFSMIMLFCVVLKPMLDSYSRHPTMSIFSIVFLMMLMALVFYSVRRIIGFIAQIEFNNFKLTKKLIRSLNMDALLSVPNRQSFFSSVNNKLSRKREISDGAAILMIDVDHFKKYNDHYGHPAGDRCLQKVASCLQSCLREDIDIVGRYGGEEFIVFLDATDTSGAQIVAERIHQRLAKMGLRHEHSDTAPHVTLSIGIASWQFGKTLDLLCEQADKALYVAKGAGRNQHAVYGDD